MNNYPASFAGNIVIVVSGRELGSRGVESKLAYYVNCLLLLSCSSVDHFSPTFSLSCVCVCVYYCLQLATILFFPERGFVQ